MATVSHHIAQQVIQNLKARCPRLVVSGGASDPHRLTFFDGTIQARVLNIVRILDHGCGYWTHLDRDLTLRKWHDPVNEKWMAQTCRGVLLDEIYHVSGIPNHGDPQNAAGMDDEVVGIIEKALHISKLKLWGIPMNTISESPFFHFLLTGYAKRAVSDTVWELACRNAGNIYNVNDLVLADAHQEQDAYQSLYTIHPLLGRAWVPWIRVFVEHAIQDDARSICYAQQFKRAMLAQGISAAGIRTLHRLAESSPTTFRRAMYYLAKHAGDERVELVAMLHFLNGKKPASGASFGQLVGKTLDPFGPPPGRSPADLDRSMQIDRWLNTDPRFDRELVHDWMRFLVNQQRGALSRGYMGAIKGISSARQRKEAVLVWANRSQAQWHRSLPQVGWICTGDDDFNYYWEPLLSGLGVERNGNGVFSYTLPLGDWIFVELCNSHALREEGEVMEHCVDFGYDTECIAGRSRIFSVRTREGYRVSTLELRPGRGKFVRVNGFKKPQFSQYWIAQHRGFNNSHVLDGCQMAAEEFLRFINRK